MKNKYFLLTLLLILIPILLHARDQDIHIKINSVPEGAKVYIDGKEYGTTPCDVKFTGKWVYDIDAHKVNPDKPPYSKKIVFVLEGYETATEYWAGEWEYHESGIGGQNKYYIAKPSGYSVMAILKKDTSIATNQDTQPRNSGINSEEYIIQCNVDSEPEEARVFWRVISKDSNVSSTEEQYLGKTPFKDKKSFRIAGLTNLNANNVSIELIVKRNGYYDVSKVFSVSEILKIMEINGYFEMEKKD